MMEDIRKISLDRYKEQMIESVESAKREMEKGVENVKSGIRERPFESVAIAAGAGLLLGAAVAFIGGRVIKKPSKM
jgi:ElaB/YqjD/DUF883 family membrane-anchored ribosome-binding protein